MTEERPKLLVVEDDPGLQRQLKWSFADFDVHVAGDRETALEILKAVQPRVVTLDLGLPPDPDGTSEGFATLEQILSVAPRTKVIVASGHGARESALRAIELGAYDFYQKPIDADELQLILRRALHLRAIEEELHKARASGTSPLEGVISGAENMQKVCRIIERVAPTDVSVLLLGASGTGKEVLARALHNLSSRKDGPFIAINCGAIPENLLESELFGHEKGAFTGAIKQTPGKVELADRGTLFLDEVGDIPIGLQVKLLRFLQERVIERIGGRKEIPIDTRIICATHRNLDELISTQLFREDLYYRLSEIVVTIPPLKDRDGDAVLLAHAFLRRFAKETSRKVTGFTEDALAAIAAFGWPGNVRQLENRLKRAIIMCDGARITAQDLELGDAESDGVDFSLKRVREEADRKAIRFALASTEFNISQAAKVLGISRPTLYDLIKQYEISL